MCALFAALLYAASTPLLTAFGGQLFHADPLQRTDVIIVLASSLDRVVEAAELYRAGYAPVVLLTREAAVPVEAFLASRGIITESGEDQRRRLLQELGVPASAIVVLERRVISTADEARRFADWARGRPIRSVMVVTSPPHTARSRLTFQRALQEADIRVIVRPSALHDFHTNTWWQSRDTLRETLYEWQKLVYYWLFE